MLKDNKGFSQMLVISALIPVIMLVLAGMINVSSVTSLQTFVQEAALQGARIGIRSETPVETATNAIILFGDGIAGWNLTDRLTINASFASQILTIEVQYEFMLLGGLLHTVTGRSSMRRVDLP
jgi:hypothetical protein